MNLIELTYFMVNGHSIELCLFMGHLVLYYKQNKQTP
jgi:hypothetical protein